MRMKALTLFAVLCMVLSAGCGRVEFTRNNEVSGDAVFCGTPYIRHADGCCLDSNANSICDDDESPNASAKNERCNPYQISLPILIKLVKAESIVMDGNLVNRIDSKPGEELEVDVEMEAVGDCPDVEVEAVVSGEDSGSEASSDKTAAFDAQDRSKYSKKLHPVLPADVYGNNYKLTIIVTDSCSRRVVNDYRLLVYSAKHEVVKKDFFLTAEKAVIGDNVSAVISIKNNGQLEEKVKISFNIPELKVGKSLVIENMEKWATESREFVFTIPKDAETGEYTANINIAYSYDSENRNYLESFWDSAPLEVVLE